jgi:lysophospholipase L1-like esterase
VLLVGDSLNVGIEPYLHESLEHWKITSDDVVGRATTDGIAAIERNRGTSGPVVISLGTNDDPENAEAFRSRVEQLLELLPSHRCVIWATLWRDGAPETGLNDVLQDVARTRSNVHLLDWAAMLRDHPDWRAPDETHGSPDGYRARAEEVARLARACSVDEGQRPSSENA